VRVDEKVLDNEFVAYAAKANFATTGFDTLHNFHVAYIIGWILFERWQGAYILRERGIKAHLLLPPLVSTEMFMCLHAKHAHLAEPVARALRAMKADGTYNRIAAQTLPGFGKH
jgi:polar amino acid transport system substrate-binding protein